MFCSILVESCFFFNDTATTVIYTYRRTLSLPDALPICAVGGGGDPLFHRQANQTAVTGGDKRSSGEASRMARVALVTGGTRGIGAAISIAMKSAGYAVAATYGGNDDAAQKFRDDHGIAVSRWDVGDFDADRTSTRLNSSH